MNDPDFEQIARNLRTAVETVVDQFTRDETQGYHSRDRQYAIDVLGRALKAARAAGEPLVNQDTG